MDKTVVTSVTVVTTNSIDEETAQQLADTAGYDSIEAYAQDLEATVEEIIAQRVFADSDSIPVLDVSTEVHDDDFDEDDL